LLVARILRRQEYNMTETEGMDKLNRWAAELQEQVEEEERAMFSQKVRELAEQPRNMGAMLEPDGHALLFGACGDSMEMFVRLDGQWIEIATFMTNGCRPTVACGSMLTTMAQGKTLEQAAAIRAADLVAALARALRLAGSEHATPGDLRLPAARPVSRRPVDGFPQPRTANATGGLARCHGIHWRQRGPQPAEPDHRRRFGQPGRDRRNGPQPGGPGWFGGGIGRGQNLGTWGIWCWT
jgi:nitrogen fixation NifU-like protein